MSSFVTKALLCLTLASPILAQTSTSCNPTENTTCPSDTGLSSSSYSIDFTTASNSTITSSWTPTSSSGLSYTSDGAEFVITSQGDAPTIQTSFYIFFGTISITMRAASGTGIVSSMVLESDDLDELDWEFIGGNSSAVETNYFGKGNTTSYDRAVWYDVSETQSESHNYTIEWTKAYTTWYIDGTAVRTLNYADALEGKNYPQTPMRLKLGIWAGGDSDENSEGTVEWAGGDTDYDDGPFTMVVESVEITNTNPGASYTYGDETGSWESITISDVASNTSSSNATNTTSLIAAAASSEIAAYESSAAGQFGASAGVIVAAVFCLL